MELYVMDQRKPLKIWSRKYAPKKDSRRTKLSTSIDSKMEQIGEFLNKVKELRVPANQRDFAWTDAEIQKFWSDITQALDNGQPDFFLGPMVLKKDGEVLEIIDGQQRIATVYIILSVIRRVLRKNGDNVIWDVLKLLNNFHYQ